jgi:hypothetical protein
VLWWLVSAQALLNWTMANRQITAFDKVLSRIKNNPVVAALLVVGTIVIAVSAFTDATQKLLGLIYTEKIPNIEGKWRTKVLTNPYDDTERYTLLFQFAQQGDTLMGTVTETDVGGREGFAKNIRDGKIKGNVVSFYTPGEVTSDQGTRHYNETYSGTIRKNQIALERLDDLPDGDMAEKFVATPAAPQSR